MVFLLCQTGSLHGELTVDDILVDAFEQHLTLLVGKFVQLVANLVVTVDELIKLVVQGRASDAAACVVDMNLNLATLHHDGHCQRLLIHIQRSQTDGIEKAREAELAVHHVTGVHILQLLILHRLQVEFATVERRDRRGALYRI